MGSTFLVSGRVMLDTGKRPFWQGSLEGSILARVFGEFDSGLRFWKARFWQRFLETPILAAISGRADSGTRFWKARFWRRFLDGSILASDSGNPDSGSDFWRGRFWQGILPGSILASDFGRGWGLLAISAGVVCLPLTFLQASWRQGGTFSAR